MSLNKEICITGNLGRDPESKYTPEGKMICEFSVAVQSGYGDNKTTEWFDCVAWEKTAETLAKYLGKGSKIQVRGDFKIEVWNRKDDGKAAGKLKITVKEFQFLSAKAEKKEEEAFGATEE